MTLPWLAGALGSLALLLGPGCAEMTRAPPPPPPPGLVMGATADPFRAALAEAGTAFADRGAALAGQPARTAQATAQLEYVAATLPVDERYARLAPGVGRDLVLAREEVRDALGIMAAAPAPTVIRAMLEAAERLRAGDRPGAAAALPAPMFRPGGAESVARLGEPGPLPQASVALVFAQQAVARLDAQAAGGSTRMDETSIGGGGITTNFGGAISSVGY